MSSQPSAGQDACPFRAEVANPRDHGEATRPRGAADYFGADRLVLGTDFAYETGAVFERAVSYVTTSGLAPGDADRVLSVNAEAHLSWRDP